MERYLEGAGARPSRRSRTRSRTRSRAASSSRSPAASRRRTSARRALLDLLVEGVPSPAKKGAADRARAAADRRLRLQDDRRPVRRAASTSSASSRARSRGDSTLVNAAHARQGARRHAAAAAGQGARARRRVRRRATSAPSRSSRTCMTGDLLLDAEHDLEPPQIGFPEPVMSFAVTPKAKGDEEKVAHGAAAALRGGSDARAAPRPADRRAAALGHEPDARRGRGRPAEAPLRRRRRAAPAARPVPGDDPQRVARAGPLQEADRRPRPVRRLPHRARAAREGTRATSSSTRSSAA